MVVNSSSPRPLTPEGVRCILPFNAVILLRDGDEVVALVETTDARSTMNKILRRIAGSGVRATTFQVRMVHESMALFEQLHRGFLAEHGRPPRDQHLVG